MEDLRKQGEDLVGGALNTALVPFRAAVSRPAQKTYLTLFLFASTTLTLFFVSSLAYVLFYYNYIPQNSVEREIHLQFGSGNPYGTAFLSSVLTSQQAYDVSLLLHLPRTPKNIATGNFMLDLSFFASKDTSPSHQIASSLNGNISTSVLGRSRRPAILTYTSPIVDTASILTGLPWHVLGWKKESEFLEVRMFEGVEFAKGLANVPQHVQVVIEADEKMQFYEVGIRIIARFGGLRWVLYHHRILSFLFFTTTFWATCMFSMALAWFMSSSLFPRDTKTARQESEPNGNVIKRALYNSESMDPASVDELSDTPHAFPALGRQIPLSFGGRVADVKKEEGEEVKQEEEIMQSTSLQPFATEADDEGDNETEGTGWMDSGIGTGVEEERAAGVQRRRKGMMADRISGSF